MAHIIDIFNIAKIFQGQEERKKESSGKNQANWTSRAQGTKEGQARCRSHQRQCNALHKCKFLLLMWQKIFILSAYFSVEMGNLPCISSRCMHGKSTDRWNRADGEHVSQSTLYKQILQKQIGRRFFTKCSQHFLRNLFLQHKFLSCKEPKNICFTDCFRADISFGNQTYRMEAQHY